MHKKLVVYPYNGTQSAIKRNELLIHAATWMSLKSIVWSEMSGSKEYICMISSIKILENAY